MNVVNLFLLALIVIPVQTVTNIRAQNISCPNLFQIQQRDKVRYLSPQQSYTVDLYTQPSFMNHEYMNIKTSVIRYNSKMYIDTMYPDNRLLMLGDSHLDFWPYLDPTTFNNLKSNYNLLNAGIAGFDTKDLLYYIALEQQLQFIDPNMIFLMIGTNNMAGSQTPYQVSQGVLAVLDALRKRYLYSKIYYAGLILYNDKQYTSEVNQLLKSLESINSDTYFIDILSKFADSNGDISANLFVDFVHLSSLGYIKVVEALLEQMRSW